MDEEQRKVFSPPHVSIIPSHEEALQQQTADFVAWERRRLEDTVRFYDKYEELKERHAEAGTDWGRRFDPLEKASYEAWLARRNGHEVGDMPLMPIE